MRCYLHHSDTILRHGILDGLKTLETELDIVEASAQLLGDAGGDQGRVRGHTGLDCDQEEHGHTGQWLHHRVQC